MRSRGYGHHRDRDIRHRRAVAGAATSAGVRRTAASSRNSDLMVSMSRIRETYVAAPRLALHLFQRRDVDCPAKIQRWLGFSSRRPKRNAPPRPLATRTLHSGHLHKARQQRHSNAATSSFKLRFHTHRLPDSPTPHSTRQPRARSVDGQRALISWVRSKKQDGTSSTLRGCTSKLGRTAAINSWLQANTLSSPAK
jgi:hypothetical protein